MSEQEFIPVYMITGFLESGKTTMIRSMLADRDFSSGQRTLILCCEDGENEYEEDELKKFNAQMVMFDEQSDMTSLRLKELNRQYKPERVIIEYNSIWTIEFISRLRLPPLWEWVQVITLADATTFENYMTNMRTILTDPMKEADLILFENPDGSTEDGVSDEDLPYDVNAPVIDISDEQYGVFYLDSMEHPERYDGKVIRTVGQPFPHARLSKGFYYFAREAMTCCANDIQKAGWICKGSQTPNARAYIRLTARCEKTTDPDGRSILVLHEEKAERAAAPKEQYVSFMNI